MTDNTSERFNRQSDYYMQYWCQDKHQSIDARLNRIDERIDRNDQRINETHRDIKASSDNTTQEIEKHFLRLEGEFMRRVDNLDGKFVKLMWLIFLFIMAVVSGMVWIGYELGKMIQI